MYRRTLTILALSVTAACLAAITPVVAADQSFSSQRPAPRPQSSDQLEAASQEPFKLERGGKVIITNPTGPITITGWDRDTIEVTARVEDRADPIRLRIRGDSRSAVISVPAEARRYGAEVALNVKVPRYAEIESAETRHGDVTVTDIEGAVFVSATHGDVTARRIGTFRVENRNGDVDVQEVKNGAVVQSLNGDVDVAGVGGSVEVKATSGDISIRNVGANVRAYSASGDIQVICAANRVDVNTASGSIELTGVGGDVEGSTASGSVIFRGLIRKNGRYSLKSLSGEVEMYVQPDPPGFTAVLTTYSGEIETQFELKINTPFRGPVNRRITGVYGDGQTQLALDSFSGTVRIVKADPAMMRECK